MTIPGITAIAATFKTTAKAKAASIAAKFSPYHVLLVGKSVIISSYDTTAASLVTWFATNYGGSYFNILSA